MGDILSFSLIVILLVMSPGPNGVLILRTTSIYGKQSATCNILGFILAMSLQASMGIFGISAILMGSPLFFVVLKYIGGGYFLYIGAKMLLGSLKSSDTALPEKIKHYTQPKWRKSVVEGFITQFSNPKGILFYLAAFPQFLDFEHFSYIDAYTLVAIHGVMLFVWFSALSLFIAKMTGSIKNTRFGCWVNRVAGVVMIYFGCVLFIQ
ncbi:MULTISPECIES: LysE family translocator [Vibrio]|uniref:LysE family translocator n=2 Tax=Vibrio TaxID=662 RepID=A0ABW7II57_9VIBR|nr:LysE family translocator [Vibrio mediterranei]MCG9660133.1 LysE family translocator [Vibrio mediterranei]PCD86435.1 LysE family translocator [Vibrio mediterranei]PRQ66605.1 LysE family translocator [Vibrio mediterranei]PTC04251.1 LysE family translocator [Vibrio mediterranei]SBO11581.1 Leucine efflux protein [Vibrio mediterranei]